MYQGTVPARQVLRKDPWSYLHAEEAIARRAQRMTEATPLAEYLFRYDRGDFRVGPFTFEYFNVLFNNFTRWWLDDFLHTRVMYKNLRASGKSKRYVVHDLASAYSTAVYPLSGSARYPRARSQLCIHSRNKQQQVEKYKSPCLILAYGDMDLLHPTTSSKPPRILNASLENWVV